MRRDSGPAVTAAVELVARGDEKNLVLVVASDHVVPKPEEFVATCVEASAAAGEGWIVTFGIAPYSAATIWAAKT
jgi:mannose-1-phosphate guanylyltransferase